MALAQQFSPVPSFNSSSENRPRYAYFEDRDKSILTVFWKMVHALEERKNLCLVLDNPKDAEHLNYLISRFQLGDLCVILSGKTPEINKHNLAKIKDSIQEEYASPDQDERTRLKQLTFLFDSAEKNLEVLRSELLREKNPVQLLDRYSQYKMDQRKNLFSIPLDPIRLENYANQRDNILQAEKLYQNSFSFLDLDFPFGHSVIENYSHAQLIEVLDQFVDSLDALLEKYNLLESRIFEEVQIEYQQANRKIKQEIETIESILGSTDSNEPKTLNQKLDHHFSRLQQWHDSKTILDSHFSIDSFELIKQRNSQLKGFHQSKLLEKYNKELAQIHEHKELGPKILELLLLTDNWLKEIVDTGIFTNIKFGQASQFKFQKSLLEGSKQKILSALHFLDNNEVFYSWKIFLHNLEESELKLIDLFSRQSIDWALDYDRLLLNQTLTETRLQLYSPSTLISQLRNDFDDFILLELSSLKAESVNRSSLDHLDSFAWDDLINQHISELSTRFPILIVGRKIYINNNKAIESAYTESVFMNSIPENMSEFDNTRNIFVATDEKLWLSIKERLALNETQIIEYYGPTASINRPLNQLTRSELNRASMHLSNALEQLDADYRVFQLKNISIISFWTDTKNSVLISKLNSKGIKEIISDVNQFNLLPGIFSNTDHKIYFLIEDGVLVNTNNLQLLRQMNLLEELHNADVEIINIDNLSTDQSLVKEIDQIENAIQSGDLVVESKQ